MLELLNIVTESYIEVDAEDLAKNTYACKSSDNVIIFIDVSVFNSLTKDQQSLLNLSMLEEEEYTPMQMVNMDVLTVKTDINFDINEFVFLFNKFKTMFDISLTHDFFIVN